MNLTPAPTPFTPVLPTSGRASRSVLGLTLRSIDLGCGDVAYIEEGTGPVIVLLHGAPLTSLGFVRVSRGLRSHYRVIAPDLPGFGFSRANEHFDGSLAAYANMVVEFCDGLHLDHFFLYVNDSSGAFGSRAAALLSHRIAGRVVADTVRWPLDGSAWIVKQVLKHVASSRFVRFLNRRFNLLPWLVATVAPWLKPFSREERTLMTAQFDSPEKRERVLDMFESMGRDEDFMRATARLASERLSRTPVLLLFGQFDPMRFVSLSALRALFPRSSTRLIPFEEHFPILSSGERVATDLHTWMEATLRDGKVAG